MSNVTTRQEFALLKGSKFVVAREVVFKVNQMSAKLTIARESKCVSIRSWQV
jgi:hypothetical protein